jgi:hypothetical protein
MGLDHDVMEDLRWELGHMHLDESAQFVLNILLSASFSLKLHRIFSSENPWIWVPGALRGLPAQEGRWDYWKRP